MSTYKKFSLKLLWLLPIVALAATPFFPDLVNSTTYVTQPVGYVGSPVASGYVLSSSQAQAVFTIDYSAQDWTGDVHSYALSNAGTVSTVDSWTNGAAYEIDAQNMVSGAWNPTGRKIVTMNGSSKVAFLWSNLSAAQKTALDSASSAAASSPVLNYIRGDHSNEVSNGGTYRTRNSVLGDIIHSTPRFWDDGTTQTVFVGANDGMLHALNAATGAEVFAYIPSVLISKLPTLKASPYSHRYFVDGQLTARNFGSQSILAGGLGGGGMGLFALDITSSPTSEADAATKILWEITNATTNFANLGHTYGTPVLAKLNSGVNALVVGNGYNNTGNGHSSLYIINPVSGARIAEIDAGAGSVAAPNGLSSPTVVDVDSDGDMDYAYAGDIDGNLWKFDLTSYTATKLYTTSPVQSITMAPGIKSHPNGGYMVTFVTGRIFEAADETNTATHYAYGIWDRPAAYAANATLLTQTLTETSFTNGASTIRVRTASNNLPDWSTHMGWKTLLPVGGERVVGDGAFVTGSVFLFLSTNPTANTSLSPPGANWWMQLNALTGGDNDGAVRFDLNSDTKFTTDTQATATRLTDQVSGVSPVGRYMGGGVRSQLTAFTTSGFDIYLANYDKNGDPPIPVGSAGSAGVAGGHFDEDIYFGSLTSGDRPTGLITFTGTSGISSYKINKDLSGSKSIRVGSSGAYGSTITIGTSKTAVQAASAVVSAVGTSGTYKAYVGGNSVTTLCASQPTNVVCIVDTSTYTNGSALSVGSISNPGGLSISLTSTAGGGTNGVEVGDSCTTCSHDTHVHQYDDKYDVTGVNYLNPSDIKFNLARAIKSTTPFKVIAQNQYLNPAVNIHIGDASYVYNVNSGYISVKNFITSNTLDVATLPTYTLGNVGSLAVNMPVDALTPKNWWGNGDIRVGLHPAPPSCVYDSDNDTDGNMYQPVIPPVNGVDGPGVKGWSSSTTPVTATGARHGGALVIQIIRDTTTNAMLEQNVSGRPEYGWRVKSAYYAAQVLAEYTTWWHHPNGKCYGDTGWTKTPGADNGSTSLSTKAAGSTDPKIGSLGVGDPPVAGTSSTTVTNADGTTTTTTVTIVVNADGTATTTTTVTNNSTGTTSTTVTGNDIDVGGAVDSSGIIGGGVTTPLEALGRVNWRELFNE